MCGKKSCFNRQKVRNRIPYTNAIQNATEWEKLLKIVLNIGEKFENRCANDKIILLKRQKNLHSVKD